MKNLDGSLIISFFDQLITGAVNLWGGAISVWLKRQEYPFAVFAASDEYARWVMEAIRFS